MSQFDDVQLDDALIGADGPEVPVRAPYRAPWRLGDIRIDGIAGSLPAFKPAASATLSCVFAPADGATDHIERYQAAKRYAEFSGDVTVYGPKQGRAYYREQHPGIDGQQLALLEPITPESRGHSSAARPSATEALWVVVTGIEDTTTLPEAVCTLDIDVQLIARWATAPSRYEVRFDHERSGFGL
ncbi:hypothetical protein [Halomarina rubra]|uniref:Uncharacterized protein n=1 Tax=Halomarina rubra TaxID=2071873 RepID=A0ABD6B3M5_9EURY|nr:hypothetical protein [Halomarina rubra]